MSQLNIAALAVVGILAHIAVAQTLVITEIADTSTAIPGSTSNFTSFGLPVADRDNPLAASDGIEQFFFQAQGPSVSGIYQYYQQPIPPAGTYSALGEIVDTNTPATTGGYYSSFSSLSAGNAEIGFIASTTTGTQLLMAGDPYNPLLVIAQTGTSPSPGVTFGSFQNLSAMEGAPPAGSGREIKGEVSTDVGIYDFNYPSGSVSSGPLTFSLVANASTTPPGASGPFTSFGPVSYMAGRSATIQGDQSTMRAMVATVNGIQGVYYGQAGPFLNTSASLVKLVDTTSAVPGGTGTFTSFDNPIIDPAETAFIANYETVKGSEQGIFNFGPYEDFGDAPELSEVVAPGELAPESGGAHFASFQTLADDGYFIATLDDGVTGIYWYAGFSVNPAEVERIVDSTETLNGKSIENFELSPEGSGDAGTAFKVDFTDGSEGVYFFSEVLPEPASLSLLSLPMLLVRRRK